MTWPRPDLCWQHLKWHQATKQRGPVSKFSQEAPKICLNNYTHKKTMALRAAVFAPSRKKINRCSLWISPSSRVRVKMKFLDKRQSCSGLHFTVLACGVVNYSLALSCPQVAPHASACDRPTEAPPTPPGPVRRLWWPASAPPSPTAHTPILSLVRHCSPSRR